MSKPLPDGVAAIDAAIARQEQIALEAKAKAHALRMARAALTGEDPTASPPSSSVEAKPQRRQRSDAGKARVKSKKRTVKHRPGLQEAVLAVIATAGQEAITIAKVRSKLYKRGFYGVPIGTLHTIISEHIEAGKVVKRGIVKKEMYYALQDVQPEEVASIVAAAVAAQPPRKEAA